MTSEFEQKNHRGSGLIGFLIKKGLIKNEVQAYAILGVVIIVSICISIFLSYKALYVPSPMPPVFSEGEGGNVIIQK